MTYERYLSKVTTHSDGREDIHIIREKSASGVGEFLGVIAAITGCVIAVAIVSSALHPQPTPPIIIQLENPR